MKKKNITDDVQTSDINGTQQSLVNKKKKKKHKELKSFILQVTTIGLVVAIGFIFFLNFQIVHANNMYPSIRDGELVLISKFTQPLNDTVVLYKTPDGNKQLGRIMAFQNNSVTISEDGGVSVDGKITYQTIPYVTPLGTIDYPYTVPENSCFIVNDYREDIADSRTFGAINIDNIVGVVVFAMQYRGF